LDPPTLYTFYLSFWDFWHRKPYPHDFLIFHSVYGPALEISSRWMLNMLTKSEVNIFMRLFQLYTKVFSQWQYTHTLRKNTRILQTNNYMHVLLAEDKSIWRVDLSRLLLTLFDERLIITGLETMAIINPKNYGTLVRRGLSFFYL